MGLGLGLGSGSILAIFQACMRTALRTACALHVHWPFYPLNWPLP